MRPSHRLLPLAALAVVGCRTAPAAPAPPVGGAPAVSVEKAAAGTELPLRFAPQTSTALWEESELSRADALGVREHVSATLSSRFSRLDGGYLLAQRMPQVRVQRGQETLEDPLMEVVRRMPIDIEVDERGGFVRLTSAAQIAPAVQSVFTRPEQVLAVMQLFAPSAVEEQARREWDAKATALYERPLKVGIPVRTSESLALPDGHELAYVLARTPQGHASTQFGRAAVLGFSCELPEGEDAGATLSCEGQQVLATERYLPVLWWMRLRAALPGDGGYQISLEKTVRTTKLEKLEELTDGRP